MTRPVQPTITAPPDPPIRNQRATFADNVGAFLSWWANVNHGEMVDYADWMDAFGDWLTGVGVSAENAALASANFKGNWSDLTGSLDIPACVYHNNLFWVLVNSLADVTASEPDQSNADWEVVAPEIASQAEMEAGTETDIRRMSPLNIRQAIGYFYYEEFTSSGTWTKPNHVRFVYVELVHGGNSGQSRVHTGAITAIPGAGGRYVWFLFRASDLSATESVVVGAGADSVIVSASSNTTVDGNIGGASSFAGYGIPAGSSYQYVAGEDSDDVRVDGLYGSSGVSRAKDSIFGGARGGYAISSADPIYLPGESLFAGNGGAGDYADDTTATATPGVAPGGGGGGAAVINITTTRTATSGAGADGIVRVWAW